jgi:hypothetical protein
MYIYEPAITTNDRNAPLLLVDSSFSLQLSQ